MLNYQAFDQKYSLKQQLSRSYDNYRATIPSNGLRFFIILAILAFFVAPAFGSIIWIFAALLSGDAGAILSSLIISATFGIALALILFSVARVGKKRLIAENFCRDNNFTFTPLMNVKDERGALFNKGDSRIASNGISGVLGGNGFILCDYRYSTGSGKNRSTHYFKVVKIRLARKFPHIFLDNKKDGSLGALEFDRSQRLTLEGDFNKYFSAYGPKEYEIEVLQILNPRVMQTLLDIREPVDIEILDDFLYIYDKGFKTKKETLQALFHAIETIVASTESVERTFTMHEQIGDYKPILKKSIWPAVITVAFVVFWLLMQFMPLIFGD